MGHATMSSQVIFIFVTSLLHIEKEWILEHLEMKYILFCAMAPQICIFLKEPKNCTEYPLTWYQI